MTLIHNLVATRLQFFRELPVIFKETMKTLFTALNDQAVDLSGILVKTSMAVSGNKSGKKDTPEEVAEVDKIAAWQ